MRLVAAFTVLLHHHFYVYQRSWSLEQIDPGAWAVGVFFAISGYLNSQSLLKRRSIAVFLTSRALRLYPALILCVGATVMLGALVTTLPLADYLGRDTFDYFWRNAGLFFGQRSLLPGVFEGNPVHGTNGSLWTLPVEACLYVTLAIAAWVLRFHRLSLGIGALMLGALLIWTSRLTSDGSLLIQPGLMFLTGVLIATLEGRGWAAAALAFGIMTLVLLAGFGGGWWLGLSVGVAALAVMIGQVRLPASFRLPNDVSYGIYLFAFPIQQLVVLVGSEFYPGLMLATTLTIVAAIVSAYGVEMPALALAVRLKQPAARSRVRFHKKAFADVTMPGRPDKVTGIGS